MAKSYIGIVKAVGKYDICIINNVGGTTGLPAGSYCVSLIESWRDYEIGGRGIGELVDQKDIEMATKVGTTQYGKKTVSYEARRVYFAMRDFKEKD